MPPKVSKRAVKVRERDVGGDLFPGLRPIKRERKSRRAPTIENPCPDWDALIQASTHDVRRLDSVIRFSSIPVTFSESTATHSFWVALYSLMIWQSLAEDEGRRLPPLEDVLRHAVTHDLAESVGGDVVRTLKYSTPEMKREVDRAEGMLVDKLLPYQVRRTAVPRPRKDVLAIVKAADFLSLWQFMRREAARKNMEIVPYYQKMIRDLTAKAREEDPLVGGIYWSMVSEAKSVAEDVFGGTGWNKRWYREI